MPALQVTGHDSSPLADVGRRTIFERWLQRDKIFPGLIFAVLLSANAFAHEYWLEPETFFLAPNQKAAVRLYVGDSLVKDREERPFQFAKTETFQLVSRSGV